MSDLLNELLKNSMEREAKKLASNGGVTEQDRYGNLLDSVKGRDIAQEETDKYYGNVSQVLNTAKNNRLKREKENAENAEGKRLNTKTKLGYAKEISEILKQHPEYLPELLEILEIIEEDLYDYLSLEKKANITLYDQALSHLVKKKTINGIPKA